MPAAHLTAVDRLADIVGRYAEALAEVIGQQLGGMAARAAREREVFSLPRFLAGEVDGTTESCRGRKNFIVAWVRRRIPIHHFSHVGTSLSSALRFSHLYYLSARGAA